MAIYNLRQIRKARLMLENKLNSQLSELDSNDPIEKDKVVWRVMSKLFYLKNMTGKDYRFLFCLLSFIDKSIFSDKNKFVRFEEKFKRYGKKRGWR